jgi:glutamyl-tRNA synthetase
MIRTRFSPSPTGMLHLGNVRAALFSALYSEKNAGHFILRIEDTDASRSEHKYVEMLQEDLKWLGLEWQEGPGVEGGPNAPYWQSKRHDIYAHYYKQLEEIELAYPCFCSDQELALNRKLQLSRGQPPRYPGTCLGLSKEEVTKRVMEGKKPALRFHVKNKQSVEFVDLVKGPQRFNSDDIGDFIIRRAEGTASFMFCNAIDDSLMKITHVLRGEDHLANTPRQLLILKALKMHAPHYGHLSLITGVDGGKLSKREGSFSLRDLREQGYISKAVLNYLARLSHAYNDPKLMTLSELADDFHLEKLSRSSAKFDENQLLHWQKEAVMALNPKQVWDWFGRGIKETVPEALQDLFVEAITPNVSFPFEAKEWSHILFADEMNFDTEQLNVLKLAGEPFFIALQKSVDTHGSDIKAILGELKENLDVSGKRLFMPIRIALTGQIHGPELIQIVGLLGKEKMRQRFDYALEAVRKE